MGMPKRWRLYFAFVIQNRIQNKIGSDSLSLYCLKILFIVNFSGEKILRYQRKKKDVKRMNARTAVLSYAACDFLSKSLITKDFPPIKW